MAQTAFDPLLAKENLWSLKQADFQAASASYPFAWTSTARESARAARPGMTLLGLPVSEVIARFDGDKVSEITAAFYARGDEGEVTEMQFKKVIEKAMAAVSAHTKTKQTVAGKDPKSAVHAEGLVWQTDQTRYLLEYSFIREVKTRDIPFRGEFVRLSITPKKTGGLMAAALAPAPLLQQSNRDAVLRARVEKRPDGDVLLKGVPMVDQGEKGYCVVASAERVMRYYGATVDANELAQICNAEAQGGTNIDAMHTALKKIAGRLKVRVRPIDEMSVKALLDLIKDYNRAAKKARSPEIPDPGLAIDVGAIFSAMDTEVLREARTRSKSDLTGFQRDVQTRIDEGIPLLWSVFLGKVPEPGIPQNAGGHMRLIIGYNLKTQEVLYSDSWGAGHELKRMAAANAWTITSGLTTIEPQ